MKKILIPALLLTLPFFSQAQTKLIEKVVKKGNELVIPYEKYKLDNGLTVIVHEDHSDPVVHVDITYHVGSNREEVGRSGFAHFFEHMMFQGSDHVADEEHFRIVSEAGGNLNGTTNSDRTNYFETLPSNQLETALWLEADRMGFLLDAVTQKKFEVQRATVKNERGQNYDNRPYGLVNEKSYRALYPYKHPYSWSTIGYVEDLDRVNVDDLKSFFLRWYGPNNAVLTVAGDINPADVVKLAEKYFGSIPKCPEVKPLSKDLVTIDKDRYISYEDNVKFPMYHMVFPAVPNRHPDEAPLDILADIIGGNKNSPIYQNLVKTQKATRASASTPSRELGGAFEIDVFAMPGSKLSEIEAIVRKSLEDFDKQEISDEELNRFKASYESQLINNLNSVSGKAAQLAFYETFTGNANYIKQDLERYMKVTKEDVKRVYNTYIKGKPAVILSVYPKGKAELAAKPDNYKFPTINPSDADHAEYKGLVYQKAKDNFDRASHPKAGAAPMVKVPALWKDNFKNGLAILGTTSNEIPSITMQLTINGGHRIEEKNKAGITKLMCDLMNESTEHYTAEQISDKLSLLGSSIDIRSGVQDITVTVTTLTKNLDATLKLVEEMLFHPKFDKDEFDMVKNNHLQAIANQSTQATTIANNVFNKLLYGENSIMAIPAIGTAGTVNTITLDEVKAFYAKAIAPEVSNLVVVGDVTKDALIPKIQFLNTTWKQTGLKIPADDKVVNNDKTKIYLINKDNAPQSEIRIGYMAMPYDATGEYYKSSLMNYALGGSFNSRINLNLREDKGYTYGANSSFRGSKYAGPFVAQAGVRGNATDSSVVEFVKEIRNFSSTGISDKELEFVKSSLGQADALKFETPVQKAGFLKKLVDYNLSPDYIQKQSTILKTITKEELDALAKKNLPLDKMIITVVGDKKSIYEGLSKLGYEIVELDADGKPAAGSNTPLYPSEKK
jgi:zinc protease